MKSEKKPLKWRNDLILAGVILTLATVFLAVFFFTGKEGEFATVSVNGDRLYNFSLQENLEKSIITQNGENVIVINNGEVSVSSADCPDKICVAHRPISKTGETIVCLPHKIVVEITEEG